MHWFRIYLNLLTRKRFDNFFDWWSLITLTLLMFLLTFCHKKCHLSNNRLFYPCFDDVVHTKKSRLLVCPTFPFTLNDSLAAWFRLPPPRRPQLQQRSLALTQLCLRKCNCVQRNSVWESVNAFNATLYAVWNKTACTKSPTSWCSTLYSMNERKYYWPFRFPQKARTMKWDSI